MTETLTNQHVVGVDFGILSDRHQNVCGQQTQGDM